MKLRRGAGRLAVVVGVVFLLQFLAQPAGATSYTISGSGDCTALGGTWTLGCTFSSLTVAAGDSLTIDPLIVVEVTGPLTVDGSIDIQGALLLDSTATINGSVTNEDLLDNSGTLTINPGGSLFNTATGQLTNEIGANVNDLSYMEVNASATVINHGTFVVGPTGSFDNYGILASDGVVTTYGLLDNYGGMVNDGVLNDAEPGYLANGPAGELDNYATFSITAEFDNYGVIKSGSSSVVVVGTGHIGDGYLFNLGAISNLGSYSVTTNGEIANYASFDNTAGTISNVGLVFNECGGTFKNTAGVSPHPVLYVPCAPTILSVSSLSPDTATLGGTENVDSGGGSPLLIDLFDYGQPNPLGSNVTTDAAGDWSVTTTPLSAGTHYLYAVATDVQSEDSLGSDTVEVIAVVSTGTQVSCSPTPVDVGTPTTCTATVTEEGGGPPTTPTGTVDWSDPGGVFTPPSCTLASNGVAGEAACSTSYVPGSGSEGSPISVTGTYLGDTDYFGSAGSYSVSSTQLGSSTSFSCSPGLLVSAPSTCTAIVTDVPSSANIFPGATVAWTSTNLGSFSGGGMCTLSEVTPHSSSCSLSYTPASGGEGSHAIEASYGGDVDHTGSSETMTLSASHRADSTTLKCAPNPDSVNQKTTCTAVVKDTTSRGSPLTPGGMVSFSSAGAGSFSHASCVLVAGTCSVTYTPNPGSEGTPTLKAAYSGDVDHPTSSNTFSLTVSKRSVSLGVACTPPFKHGSSISCAITVVDTSPGAALTPKGVVTVTTLGPHGASSTHTCTLSGGGGTASCAISFVPASAGSFSVKAAYPGDANHVAAATTITITVA